MELIDVIFSENRELTKHELMNLNVKKNSIPVEYFRKNLFNATTRTSQELKRNKTIFDDGTNKIKVNRSLHQKHRDLLSILFTDNKEIITNNDGSMSIKTSLYHLSKEMGYKLPKDGVHVVKNFLWDLENTKFIFQNNLENGHYLEQSHSLIGNHIYDTKVDSYIINIPSETNKYKILNFAVEIPREINRKIIKIPNKYAKTKALISYILSNKALKNGVSLIGICDKLDIKNGNISRFKKELRENKELLNDFNISYDIESGVIKYEQLCDIKFHRAMKEEEIIKQINKEKLIDIVKETNEKENEISYFYKYIGKKLQHKDESGEPTKSIIQGFPKNETNDNEYFIQVLRENGKSMKTSIPLTINMLKGFEDSME